MLTSVLGQQVLNDEGLQMLFCEVEAILNDRPIAKVSDDPNDLEALTSNHILLPIFPPGLFEQSDLYIRRCRLCLIRQSPDSIRGGQKRLNTAASTAVLSLVNEAQYLLINQASVDLIQEQIRSRQESSEDGQPLERQDLISRFRANLVIAGVEPFEEDSWSQLIIRNAQFLVGVRCGRCQMICVDQDTGAKSKAPLLALSACRSGKLTFGVYLSRQVQGDSPSARTLSVEYLFAYVFSL
ncbi:molybdenum cofactor sulfurase-like [Gadus macrocephalus]|uniref:molybdenum cofactor sulfurase-like n=1 Tax=Gadus macrocephalus TaxID=80720 RepID=UPI0028CB7AF0|nr:molybdenum cofactor sulfurase-like [Gadus macrocephalus]